MQCSSQRATGRRSAVLARWTATIAVVILMAPRVAAAQERGSIEIFTRPGCPHCEHAGRWLDDVASRRDLDVRRHDVVADRSARDRLERLAAERGIEPVAVPAILAGGRLFVGFDSAATTGRTIERWLDDAPDEAADEAATSCAPSDAACADEVIAVPFLGELRPGDLGLPLFTIVLGLVDGFNPCAMWVLLFLLSMLVHLQDRKRMALIAGTFVLVSALVYYAFMAAWLELFLLIGLSRAIQIVLGTFALAVAAVHIKDFATPGHGPSLSIPKTAKPGIYARARAIVRAEHLPAALALAAVLALLVNFVELLCTAGLPALYTQILASHGLSRAEHLAYLALYDLAYMLDDGIMVTIGVVTLSQRKLQERGGRWLKLVSGVVVGALGLVLLLAPDWLAWGPP